MVTQNVNGFGASAAARDAWLGAFRTTDEHGRFDVVLLQETHVGATDVRGAEQAHAQRWGFRTGGENPRLSYWAPSHDAKGRVGILLDPYGGFTNVAPYAEAEWTPHLMAVSGDIDGQHWIVVNVYAPHQPAKRERFYRQLISLRIPPAVREVATHWGLIDPVALRRPDAWSDETLLRHRQDTHTYFYTIPGSGPASSRLDRWYVAPAALDWVAHSETFDAGSRSDHKGVKLHLVSPSDPIRIRKPTRVFPVPKYAEKAVRQRTRELIQELTVRLETERYTPAKWAEVWEDFKVAVVKTTLRVKKERRKAVKGGLQQKLKRLLRRQQQRHLEEDRGLTGTVASITDLFAALSLEDVAGPNRAARVRRAISDCKRELAALRQRRAFTEGGHWTGKTTKLRFKRVSAKYQDNTIRRLDPVEGAPDRDVHDKHNIFGDAWTPILQQPATPCHAVTEVTEWMDAPASTSPEQLAVAGTITELEVTAAIQACKVGKATGPDRLGNDWYRAFAAEIMPVFTILLDKWYEGGVFRALFSTQTFSA
ncbi:hypothetical protein PInf_008761 [Phytophthora infestans]|nr:hypothetical protein PInf_008761 [Phytophthora infestans]